MKMVGVVRLELTTSCSQSTRASQTVLHPEMALPLGLEPRTYGLTDRRYQPAELREHKERRIERRKKKNVTKMEESHFQS